MTGPEAAKVAAEIGVELRNQLAIIASGTKSVFLRLPIGHPSAPILSMVHTAAGRASTLTARLLQLGAEEGVAPRRPPIAHEETEAGRKG